MRRGTWVHGISLLLAAMIGVVFLFIVASLVKDGLSSITWRFLVSAPDNTAGAGGIGPELFNTVLMVGITLVVTIPLGLMTAIFQQEYRGSRRRKRSIEVIRLRATLLSVPTIVVALIVYRIAVGWWHWPVSVLTGCLALVVINWPFLAAVSAGALASVPDSYREASLALGASRFETTMRVVLPASLGMLIDGWGLSFARLAGETAALIVTAGVNVSRHWSLLGPGETLAVHMWYIRTEGVSANRDGQAAATGVVLMVLITVVVWIAGRVARLVSGSVSRRGGR